MDSAAACPPCPRKALFQKQRGVTSKHSQTLRKSGYEKNDIMSSKAKIQFEHELSMNLKALDKDSFSDSDSNNPPANAIKNIFQNDYDVIKLAGKKSVRFYVGVIISQDAFDEYTVKFMRKCGKDKFTFPENDDIAEVDSSNIVNVSQPSLNKRE
ncbi:hypothetical protein AVEN_13265-1 [Araneus ventricosus]|uniref:Uncharacterized protein n=1 Tax=Araneus ventricosus TaxID=182803 RepID=A0A4Y2QQG3_ARAVE|nr:hypothetical protein AVEN_13265-1 [Araneus ventricosus]